MARRLFGELQHTSATCALFLSGIAVMLSAPVVQGQTEPASIRVESNQVLVPVDVWDMRRASDLVNEDPNVLQRELTANDPHLWQDVEILGLVAKDFQLFEDGKEQIIQSVTLKLSPYSQVRDNAGQHIEEIGSGGGRWDFPDMPNDGIPRALFSWPSYVLAYAPPPSAEGSCHKVKVKVPSHPDADVSSLTKYCTVKLSPSDPLKGTKFGSQMERDLSSGKNGKIPVSLAAAILFADTGQANISIRLEFPSKALHYELQETEYETVGMLAKISARDGTLTEVLSDFECCQNDRGMGAPAWIFRGTGANIVYAPAGYAAQISLPPGEYTLSVILSDGVKFGRTELPLTVPRRDPHQLSLSDVVLAKRCRPAQNQSPPSSEHAPFESRQTYVPLVSRAVEYTLADDTNFQRTDSFFYYFELYEPQPADSSTAAATQAHLRIVDSKTGAVIKNLEPIDAASYVLPGKSVIPIGGGIHIQDLPSGSYRLEVQGTGSSGQATPWHAANFTVK